MAKEPVDVVKLVDDHKPKNFKFKFIITDNTLIDELIEKNYDMSSLDTINNEALVNEALQCQCKEYDRTIVGKAKQPTIFDDNTMITKKMVTKADKKLLGVFMGIFGNNSQHIVIKLRYERFDIIEIFNLI
jgi:hypothetical protein